MMYVICDIGYVMIDRRCAARLQLERPGAKSWLQGLQSLNLRARAQTAAQESQSTCICAEETRDDDEGEEGDDEEDSDPERSMSVHSFDSAAPITGSERSKSISFVSSISAVGGRIEALQVPLFSFPLLAAAMALAIYKCTDERP